MKKFMKPMLFCILLGLMLIMPDKISANKASTADTFYYYENGHAQYNGQVINTLKPIMVRFLHIVTRPLSTAQEENQSHIK